MIKDIAFNEMATETIAKMNKGIFLNVKSEDKADKVNTMTIGWGTIGVIWHKPVFMVAVRYSRYTYTLLEKTDEFTVSIPLAKDMKKELRYCGSMSGRDVDKFRECGLTAMKGKVVNTPVIGECNLHYECKIVYRQAMEPGMIHADIKKTAYGNNDFHVLYYGEIAASYVREQ